MKKFKEEVLELLEMNDFENNIQIQNTIDSSAPFSYGQKAIRQAFSPVFVLIRLIRHGLKKETP